MRTAVFVQNYNFFGSRLMHLPLADALKRSEGGAELFLFVPYQEAWFAEQGVADAVFHYGPGISRMVRRLRRLRVQRVVSLRPSSLWLNLAIGLSGAPQRIGYGSACNALFTATVGRDRGTYRPFNYLQVLHPLGIRARPDNYFRRLADTPSARRPHPAFCLMPGGGAGAFKRWGLVRFIELTRRLRRRYPGAAFHIVLGEQERDYQRVLETTDECADWTVLFNANVAQCASIVAASDVTIANDCGPCHIAQMMAVPYVGLFSNHDGAVAARIAEWFHPHARSLALASAPGLALQTLSIERVLAGVEQVLDPTRTDAPAPTAAASH